MTYKISQEIHPNNETRLTLWKERAKKLSLVDQASNFLGDVASEMQTTSQNAQTLPPHSTYVPNSEPTQITCRSHAYARTDFGLNTFRRIMHAAGACDRHDPTVGNYLFLTATLPGDTAEAKWAIANYSHILIDRLKSWLSKRLLDRKEFYVWEHQKRGALHFHYCIHVPDQSIQGDVLMNFKRQWARLLDSVGATFGVNFWGEWSKKPLRYRVAILQARVERVRKSVGAYMAGYLSGKGSKHFDDRKHDNYPKRWFGVSRPLSALIKTYTEKIVDEFSSFRLAMEFFHKKEELFLDEVLTDKAYPHKIGEGKTHVFYHTREKQEELWQSNKMLTHTRTTHPNISGMIQVCLKATLDGQRLVTRSKKSKDMLSPKSFGYFEDSTYLVSLRRGAISQTHLRALMEAFTRFDSSIDSPFLTSTFADSIRRANNLASHYRSQLRWNQYGWLANDQDVVRGIDISREGVYAGTSFERGDVKGGDGSRAHVASEPPPSPTQLFLF